MALIGPRPERPAFCAEFEKRIHGWSYRTLVKPGLSDLAQVRGGYDLLPKEKVALDLWRVEYPILRIARVTDPPHSSIISTALRLCSSVQLGIRELWSGKDKLDFLLGSVRPKLTYSIFPIWDDNAREQFEFAPGH